MTDPGCTTLIERLKQFFLAHIQKFRISATVAPRSCVSGSKYDRYGVIEFPQKNSVVRVDAFSRCANLVPRPTVGFLNSQELVLRTFWDCKLELNFVPPARRSFSERGATGKQD